MQLVDDRRRDLERKPLIRSWPRLSGQTGTGATCQHGGRHEGRRDDGVAGRAVSLLAAAVSAGSGGAGPRGGGRRPSAR